LYNNIYEKPSSSAIFLQSGGKVYEVFNPAQQKDGL
jgi:hypothetical protein